MLWKKNPLSGSYLDKSICQTSTCAVNVNVRGRETCRERSVKIWISPHKVSKGKCGSEVDRTLRSVLRLKCLVSTFKRQNITETVKNELNYDSLSALSRQADSGPQKWSCGQILWMQEVLQLPAVTSSIFPTTG